MGGRDIGVVSMVLTLGCGGGVCGVNLTSSHSSSGLLFLGGVFFFASRVPLCVRVRGLELEKRLLRVPSSCPSSLRMFQRGSHRTDINILCLLHAWHISSGCRYN